MDRDPQAAAHFYRLVRNFAESATSMTADVIRYRVKPHEEFDCTRVSYQVYGRFDEFLAVAAAAGLDDFDQPLVQQTLAMPNEARLIQMKREAGFESLAEYRADGAPTWLLDDG